MSTSDTIVPMKDASGMPVDPNVRIPDSVKNAASAADQIHAAAYAQNTPEPVHQQQEPVPQPTASEIAARAGDDRGPLEQPQHQEQRAAAQQGDDFTAPADAASLKDSEWARRYNSMRGRYEGAVRQLGSMEEQMRQLAVELQRTQTLLEQAGGAQPLAQPSSVQRPVHGNVITEEDRQSYGDDLIDLARRAAQDVMGPELENLRAENQRLTQRVQSSGKRDMFVAMDRDVPNWRQINRDSRFLGWLRLPNIYTGQPRGKTLNDAVKDANASRAIAVFKDFLAEATATGQMPQPLPQTEQPLAPHVAALSLDTLAAPGRARPAGGDSQVPADKPTYTRAQISTFYDDKRRGRYAGREAEVIAFENDLTAAQREGRIKG